jgi:hypothetical protein
MKRQLLAFPVLVTCLALAAQANDPPAPQTTSGEIILEQLTRVDFGPNGQPITTKRSMRVRMRAENGMEWSTLPTAKWQLSKGNDFTIINPLNWHQGAARRTGDPAPEPAGETLQQLANGIIGKKVEDGVAIAGEWATYQLGPTRERPAWVERMESWYRADKGPDGKPVVRLHRRLVTSPYKRETVDYFYVESTRLHSSLFSGETNP